MNDKHPYAVTKSTVSYVLTWDNNVPKILGDVFISYLKIHFIQQLTYNLILINNNKDESNIWNINIRHSFISSMLKLDKHFVGDQNLHG